MNPAPPFAYSEEAARLEVDLARTALEKADREAARTHFHNAVARLAAGDRSETSGVLVAATLELSSLNFILGKGFGETIPFLQAALKAADHLGDLRSRAMIKLHLGRHYYFSNQRSKAIPFFQQGKAEVEALGDEDIREGAAEFVGLYYHLQGMFTEAIAYFEAAVERFETTRGLLVPNPSAPMWLGYCAAYLGQFHRAIGTLDYYRRMLLERGDRALAATTRAVLGIVLLELKKNKEAVIHLSGAISEGEKTGNDLALYFARGGMAYYHFTEGRLEEANRYITHAITEGTAAGLVRQYATPIFLEMGFELYKAGKPIFSETEMQREVMRIMREPNIHLKGVLLRLMAEQRLFLGAEPEAVEKDLEASEEYLKRSGTPVQLAKTRFILMRICLKRDDPAGARRQARQAWKELAGYGDIFFPDDLRHLLAEDAAPEPAPEAKEEFLLRFIDIISELMPGPAPDRMLARLVQATNRYFGAERGALFWFSDSPKKPPVLRAACNLTETEVFSNGFRSNLALVFDAWRQDRPILVGRSDRPDFPYREKAILCLPFQTEGRPRGVLYHDNAYVTDCFNFLDQAQLNRLMHTLGSYIEHACGPSRGMEKAPPPAAVSSIATGSAEIVGESSQIRTVLNQVSQVAPTDSTVLILGETGVGKELVARRIHEQSRRCDMPLIVVDPTAIPEGLVESELFGYEKGAFTGADRQKKGLLELAHQGTLFIDEVGEIPKSIQVKLLRALQEKTIQRLGGTKPIFTDFRLIAATNRDLAGEVAAGRFREDLYYRLNVIPIVVPPLRERRQDIVLLAACFLRRHSLRHNRPGMVLTPEVQDRLRAYRWPGNVRELENMIERGVLLSAGENLELDLPAGPARSGADPFADLPTIDELQRRYIQHVLEKTGGKIAGVNGAAKILGMKRTSLYNRMKRLDMRGK
ncbi:MAG: sigma 54-interacting transcriptional regulator [Thermodesulfobacteriota bacterium]